MSKLLRSNLPTTQKVELAASAIAWQGYYGAVTFLGKEYGVSRPTVYSVGEEATQVLESHFSRPDGCWVWVDRAQMDRACVSLRLLSPTTIRSIEDLLPILYPGASVPCYGTIQATLKDAEENAASFNVGAELSTIKEAALDEMFSQGDPVLAAVDLYSGYLFLLSHEASRKGDDWARLLQAATEQGLALEVVVKDAARGIAAGVSKVFPNAEQRDDCFHAHYEMGKVRQRLEKKGYAAIRALDELIQKGADSKAIREARKRCDQALEKHDQFEMAMRDVQEAMECIDLKTGRIRTAEQMQSIIEHAAMSMKSLADEACIKVGTYIANRAPGLALHMKALEQEFSRLGEMHGAEAVRLTVMALRLMADIKNDRRPWSRHEEEKLFQSIMKALHELTGAAYERVVGDVAHVLAMRHRASSAIEGFNAALRPHLYVHKGVSQGFLELFRAWFNLRKRRWGYRKGTRAYEVVTGKAAGDWLTLLGFPPSTPHTVH